MPLHARIIVMLVIVVPLLATLLAPFLVWGWGFSWVDLGLLIGMYLATGLGITVGYHRLFVHRSFNTYAPIKVILAILGSMSVEGSLLAWVAMHRRHHQHSDTPEDPHSPHLGGKGLRGLLQGYWHAHIGWFFESDPANLDHYVKDLSPSRSVRVVSKLFPLWIVGGLILPAAVGGLINGWSGALTGLIWGGLMRIFLVHHVTWSVNSACHLWGSRPFESGDESRNNYLVGILALGEGFHNTHHAFPTSARHGLRWWQIDLSYYFIRLLALVGLAWDVKVPSLAAQRQLQRT